MLFTFDTTHHALWAEEVAREARLPVEVVPAPPEANAKCNLALRTLPDEVEALADLLTEYSIRFERFERNGG